MLAEDFNDISSVCEKKGGLPASIQCCQKMRKIMDNCKVDNMETRGPKFTWRGPIFHGGKRIYEKLDKALSNDEWRVQFPDVVVKVLIRVDFSDHHPILIKLYEDNQIYRERPFCFENAWIMHESYQGMLQDVWRDDQTFTHNLKNVVDGIHSWKFETFDQIKRTKRLLIRRLEGVQNNLQMRDNVGGMKKLEKNLQSELNDILNKEEMMWFQRSRTMWLWDGDRNTKYYHMKTLARRKRNKIVMLKDDDGAWISVHEALKGLVRRFYHDLFKVQNRWCNWSKTQVGYPKLNANNLERLQQNISGEEVKRAFYSMKSWKALGPDGFPPGF